MKAEKMDNLKVIVEYRDRKVRGAENITLNEVKGYVNAIRKMWDFLNIISVSAYDEDENMVYSWRSSDE
jgi:hypothetical protein